MWRLVIIALLGLPMGFVGMWLGDRTPPTTILQAKVVGPPIVPGGQLRVQYTIRRFRSCAITVDRVMYDSSGVRYALEDRVFVASPGPVGDDSYIVVVDIPPTFSVGRGRYRITTVYRCNPMHALWPIMVPTTDLAFDVVAAR